jgi:choice-of-anchor B domain-containing protein
LALKYFQAYFFIYLAAAILKKLYMNKVYVFLLTLVSAFIVKSQTPDLNITFKSNVPFGTVQSDLSNICGYTATDGTEYALVGWQQGVKIYNITNPSSPVFITNITGLTSIWREIKVNGTYAYITTEGGGGLKIANLANLPNATIPIVDWTGPINGVSIGNIHALHIDNNKVYLYGATSTGNSGAAIVANIAGTNATSPVYLGTYSNPNGAYVHDGYVRNDTIYASHINNGFMSIAKFNNATGQSTIIANNIVTPTAFTHNTWLNQASTHVFTTDENSNSFLGVYDITNPTNPVEVARGQSQNPNSGSVIHNTHIVQKIGGEFAVTSWYTDGVVITDVTRPTNPVNVAWYDTYTQGNGNGFNGCWGVYPFFPSGNIVCSDIDNGLYVLQPNYVRACYFEGSVLDSITNQPINGANIAITISASNIINKTSNLVGDFATGYVNAGTYSVTVSKVGYIPQTFSVNLSNGVVTLKTIKLLPSLPITATITVLDNNNLPIPNAKIAIDGSSGVFNVQTNNSGISVLNNFPSGINQIVAAKWAYVTKCTSLSLNSGNPSATIILNKGYYDDFSTNNQWQVTSTATTGSWVRGVPNGTTLSGSASNPGFDISGDCGNQAFVTGNAGGAAATDDVDNGNTVLLSPKFILSKNPASIPYIQYYRWFFNAGGSGNPNDSMEIRLKVNNQKFLLEKITAISPNNSSWVKKTINVSSYFNAGDSLQLEIETADNTPGHIVEGGFDGFRAIDSAASGLGLSSTGLSQSNVTIFPNPNNGLFVIKVNTSNEIPFTYQITDVLGRRVEQSTFYTKEKEIDMKNTKGVYYIEVLDRNQNKLIVQKIIVQ